MPGFRERSAPGKTIFILIRQDAPDFNPRYFLSTDRSIRFLTSLGGASTSRVLNLSQVALTNTENPEYRSQPFFQSPIINTAFLLKHRVRSDETYMFPALRPVATKIIVPFDINDLRAGGRSFFVDQRGYLETLRSIGNYREGEIERDMEVLRLVNTIPSLDPFLLREHLRNYNFKIAPCYFSIAQGDQRRMHEFVSDELSKLIQLASGGDGNGTDAAASRMVSALLSSEVDEKLAPLRATLGLTGEDFREGVFSWRGFLYYKWSMGNFWPDVMSILREVKEVRPIGPMDTELRAYLASTKRSIIEMVRDNGNHVNKVLSIYDESFNDLVTHQTPKTFRDFLLSAPHMFLELGEKMGSISHIVSFWRYRFPRNTPKTVDPEELTSIFQDFTSGFAQNSGTSRTSLRAAS